MLWVAKVVLFFELPKCLREFYGLMMLLILFQLFLLHSDVSLEVAAQAQQ